MNIKKTYGKQKTAKTAVVLPRKSQNNETLDENNWKDDFDTTFDKLLLKTDDNKAKNQAKPLRNKVRVEYNFDSSLNETKIQKAKSKPQKKRKTKPKLDESSPDEFYEMYLEDKRKKLKVKRQQRATMKRVEISTPVQTKLHKKKENLLFEVSPIRPGDGSMVEYTESDKSRGASLYLELRQKRLKEIDEKDEERMKGRRKRPLRSSENVQAPIEEKVPENIDPVKESCAEISAILPDESMIIHKRRKVSGNKKKKPARDVANSMNSQEWINDLKIPEINVSEASEIEDEIPMKPILNVSKESKEDERSELDVPQEALLTEENRKLEDSLEKSIESSTFEEFILMSPDNSLLTQESSLTNKISSPLCDLEKTFENVIEEISRKLAKKSVAINLVPAVRNISHHKSHSPLRTIATRSSRKHSEVLVAKKSVGFSLADESTKTVALQSGKWRKSLIAWRKSQNTEKSSLPSNITVESKVERYSQKIVSVLENSVLLEQSDEGNLHAALSILDASIKVAATFHDQRKTWQRQTSVFDRSSIFYGLQPDNLIDPTSTDVLSARQIALRRCGQQDPLPFDVIYSESELPNCCKIGEGVYGEVFMYKCPTTHQPIVLKIIPIEGDLLVNGEPQKRFDEILQEIVISMELSALRNGKDFSTDGFVNVKRVTCVEGAYPLHLVDEWELYRDNRAEGSDNDHPEIFGDDQLYIVFELCNGGKDLEAFVFNNAAEAQSVFLQTALTLAVAEQKFEFEHRDLHWGNILIAPTADKFNEFRIGGKVVKLLTHGVKVTIIDYSLSRMVYDGAILFNNIARDEELFQSSGDYQFDIYRLMRDRVENDFARYEPFTNLLWLHYIVDKLINGARYRYSKTKKHRAAVNEMMQERDDLLNFTSAWDYINHMDF